MIGLEQESISHGLNPGYFRTSQPNLVSVDFGVGPVENPVLTRYEECCGAAPSLVSKPASAWSKSTFVTPPSVEKEL